MNKTNNEIPKERIIKLIEIFLPEAKIFLFGSRARGDNTIRSDIDIAIDAGEQISIPQMAQLRNMIDGLNMPQKTDLVDFNRIPKALKDNIIKERVIWKN